MRDHVALVVSVLTGVDSGVKANSLGCIYWVLLESPELGIVAHIAPYCGQGMYCTLAKVTEHLVLQRSTT